MSTGKNHILFQAYGNKEILAECRLALLQLLKYHDTKEIILVLYTDDPAYFLKELAAFDNKIIEVVTPELISKWRGNIDFVHRVKVEILADFFSKHSGNLLYCDTDTYCLRSLQPVFQQIENNALYMHTNEGLISDAGNTVMKKWHRFLTAHQPEITGIKAAAIPAMTMWNAGVIGINSSKAHLLKQVLTLTDSIYPLFSKHTVEQFAFSYVFQQHAAVMPAEQYIFHYWDLKEYREWLNRFYEINQELPLKELESSIQAYLPAPMMRDKMDYKKLPFFKKLFAKKWGINRYMAKLLNDTSK